LGERLLCKQEVIGSIPFTSTDPTTKIRNWNGSGVCDRTCDPMAFGEDWVFPGYLGRARLVAPRARLRVGVD
jgi:hypothetical protein